MLRGVDGRGANIMAAVIVLLLIVVGSTVTAVAQSSYSVHRCRGLWTGNSCIGTWSNVDPHEYHHGDTYIEDDKHLHVQQRPEHED
jgi:hypothetical protein